MDTPTYPPPFNRSTLRAAARRNRATKRPSQGVTKPRKPSPTHPLPAIAFECRALRRAAQKARRAAARRDAREGDGIGLNDHIDWTPLGIW